MTLLSFPSLRAMLTPIALLTLCSASIKADSFVVLNANGSFQSGGVLSGTVTLDQTTGVFTSVDLVVSSPVSLTFTSLPATYNNSPAPGTTDVQSSPSSAPQFPILTFAVFAPSLIGYNGGQLASSLNQIIYQGNNYESAINYTFTNYDTLAFGSLTPAPEPASLLLVGFGLTVALGLTRRFFRAKTIC
jgi:hypothetical protein